MRYLNIRVFQSSLVVLILLFLFLNPSANAEPSGETKVCFNWAFGAMVGQDNDRRLVAITRDTTLLSGDQLKLLVELKRMCFVYLIYHNQENDIYMLFPYNLEQFAADYEISKRYYIPPGDTWFELDEKTGLETFYLLASSKRLVELEAFFIKNKLDVSVDKKERAAQIIKIIRKIKKQNKKFTTTAERPVPIGGNIRSLHRKKNNTPDINPIAAQVSAASFYSRTFTIEHN